MCESLLHLKILNSFYPLIISQTPRLFQIQVSDGLNRSIMLQNMPPGEDWYVLILVRVAWTWFLSCTCVYSIWPYPLMSEWWCHEMRVFLVLTASCSTTVYALGQSQTFGICWSMCGLRGIYYTYCTNGWNYFLTENHDYNYELQTYHDALCLSWKQCYQPLEDWMVTESTSLGLNTVQYMAVVMGLT